MKLLTYLYNQSNNKSLLFLTLGILSGFSNAAILGFIDFVVGEINHQTTIQYSRITIFFLVVAFFFLSQRIFSRYLIRLTEEIIFNVRLKILEAIRQINYADYQKVGSEKVYTCLTQDTDRLSNAASAIIYAITALITILFCIVYMAYISWIAFLLTVVIIVAGVMVYWIRQKKIEKDLSTARDLETKLFYYVKDLLFGFKELKMNRKKSNDLHANYIVKTGHHSKDLTIKAIAKLLDNSLTGQALLFMLIGFILFVFPLISDDTESVITYIFIILYISGPFETLMALIPAITEAEIAIDRINDIEQFATTLNTHAPNLNAENEVSSFNTLSLNKVSFAYEEALSGFKIGPIDLTIRKGEVVFLTGGNGSGKTTLFNLILGLYHPNNGNISIDNIVLQPEDSDQYSVLFSPVFADFYLFETFYGLSEVDEKRVKKYLTLMELDHIVTFEDGKFSEISLSTGQRKRLALIIALLDDRPILALDEWAADQDPIFRKRFYEQLIPEFVKDGKTIVAITHDDKYFHTADQLIKMEYGKII